VRLRPASHGRKSGFIPAAARLADPDRKDAPPDLHGREPSQPETLAENVNRQLKEDGRSIVIVSEGFRRRLPGRGAGWLRAHSSTERARLAAAQVVSNYPQQGGAPGPRPGELASAWSAPALHFDPCFPRGRSRKPTEWAARPWRLPWRDGSGWMATILRRPGSEYEAFFDKVPLEKVANDGEASFPRAGWRPSGIDVTQDDLRVDLTAIACARSSATAGRRPASREGCSDSLGCGFPSVEKKLPPYVPVRYPVRGSIRAHTGGRSSSGDSGEALRVGSAPAKSRRASGGRQLVLGKGLSGRCSKDAPGAPRIPCTGRRSAGGRTPTRVEANELIVHGDVGGAPVPVPSVARPSPRSPGCRSLEPAWTVLVTALGPPRGTRRDRPGQIRPLVDGVVGQARQNAPVHLPKGGKDVGPSSWSRGNLA